MFRPEKNCDVEMPWEPSVISPKLRASIEEGKVLTCPGATYVLTLDWPLGNGDYNQKLICNLFTELGIPLNKNEGVPSFGVFYTEVGGGNRSRKIHLYNIRLSNEIENGLAIKLNTTLLDSFIIDPNTNETIRHRPEFVERDMVQHEMRLALAKKALEEAQRRTDEAQRRVEMERKRVDGILDSGEGGFRVKI